MANLAVGQVFLDLKAAWLAITAQCGLMGKDWWCAKANSTRLRAVCGRHQMCPEQAAEVFQLPDYAQRILESDPGAFVKASHSFRFFCFRAKFLVACMLADCMYTLTHLPNRKC